jgi:DNA-binding Lrp family transcriptional regulator
MTTKEKIIELRKEKLSYNEISEKLNISKSTISYHCKRSGYNEIGLGYDLIKDETISEMRDYYLNHTVEETSIKYGVSKSSVKKYVDKKRIIYTDKERKERGVIRVVSWRQKIKKKCVDYKGGKCKICEYDKCIGALEFHHLDPNEKDFRISSGIKKWELVKKEIEKCILVCSNCHREIHYGLIEEYKI